MSLYRFTPTLGLALALALAPAASAQITFAFNFNDPANTGFNDVTEGAARRGALQSAASSLASYFTGYSARTVTFDVTSETNAGSGTLASAGSSFLSVANSFQPGLVQRLIQTGLNHGYAVQGEITWNFGHTWDYDDSVSAGAFDFKAVAIHELSHTLGFATLMNASGASVFGNNVYSTFDQFLTDASGNRLVNTSASYVGGTILSNGVGGDVYFSGTNAMAAFGGNRVPMYSPVTYSAGSSLSHLNTDFFTSNAYVMEHAVAAGPATRTLSAIELGILADLGYSVGAIPEPATFASIFGAGILVLVVRRRRRAHSN
jgi:hypothetical protein